MGLNSFLDRLKKQIEGKYFGNFDSKLKGIGMDLYAVRNYNYGDDKKRINRKQSAKYDKLLVSVMNQESDLIINVYCDVNYNWTNHIDEIFDEFENLIKKNYKIKFHFHYVDLNFDLKRSFVSDISSLYFVRDQIGAIVDAGTKKYRSNIIDLISIHKNNIRNIGVFVSDMIDLDKENYRLLKIWTLESSVYIIKIDVSVFEGVNYLFV